MRSDEIIGHDIIMNSLRRSIASGRIFHSYLFEGEESIGKRKVASVFAKALLCNRGRDEACNECISCIKFDPGNHPDFQLIGPENQLINIRMIYRLVNTINIAPLESNRKVIIIDDCHCMRLEAQNTLLKTLEDPPNYINIILITSNPGRLVPTILSRCQVVKFHPVESSRITELLMARYNRTWEEANFIAHFTKGSVGRSIQIAESPDFETNRHKIIELIDRVIAGDRMDIFTARDFFLDNKEAIEDVLDIMLYWFRDLAIYKETGDSGLIINMDSISLLSKQSYLGMDRINDIIEGIMEAKDNVLGSINYQLSIETMLLGMQEV